MPEYIPREALLAQETVMHDEDGFDCFCVLSADVRRIPAADVVAVVRCAKCRHWDIARHVCNSGRNYIFYVTKPDFFCAAGERRGEDEGESS